MREHLGDAVKEITDLCSFCKKENCDVEGFVRKKKGLSVIVMECREADRVGNKQEP